MATSDDAGAPELGSERLRRMTARNRPPENELPGSLALDRVIGRAADLAVILVGGRLYSGGVELDVLVLLNHADDSLDADEALTEQAFADEASAASGTALLLGVEYPDGRKATNLRAGPVHLRRCHRR